MGDEGADQVGVGRHQGKAVDRTAAAGEQVDLADAQRLDHTPDVVGVLLRGRLRGVVGALAATDAARVVGHDRPVGEVRGQGGEAAGLHGRADHHQHRTIRRRVGQVAPDVVRDGRAGASRLWVRMSLSVVGWLVTGCPVRRGVFVDRPELLPILIGSRPDIVRLQPEDPVEGHAIVVPQQGRSGAPSRSGWDVRPVRCRSSCH